MTTPACGIDFSTRALHVALVSGRELLSAKRYALGETVASQTGVITKLAMTLHEEHGPLLVYTERPFLLKGDRMNPKTTIALALLVGAIRGIFTASGHTVELISADEWRSTILDHYERDRASKKASAIRVVQQEFGVDLRGDDNTGDAVCLALYGRQIQRREALING